MGICRSCFGQSSPERLPKGDLNDQDVGLASSIIEFMKEGCSWRRNEIKKRQFCPQEKQRQQVEKDKEFSTLKECLLASPVLNSYNSNGDQAHHHVLKQNKVYPSDYVSNPRDSFSKQRLLMVGEVGSSEVDVSSSLSRSQSGKKKKRVSFKLPEEADIIVL